MSKEPVDRSTLKRKIQELKQKRATALEGKDSEALRRVRRQIHRLKGRMRRLSA